MLTPAGAPRRAGPGLDLVAADIAVTTACNLRCVYCYQRGASSTTITPPDLDAAVDLIAGSTARRRSLAFHGGEPLVAADLVRRGVRRARRAAPALELELATNGVALDERTTGFLEEHEVTIRLSHDGLPASQAWRGRESFARLDAWLRTTRAARPRFFRSRLSCALTVHSGNARRLAASVAYLMRRGVQDIRVGVILTPDPGWKAGTAALLDTACRALYGLSIAWLRRTGEVPLAMFQRPADRLHAGARAEGPGACSAATGAALSVDPLGSVYPCPLFDPALRGPSPPGAHARLAALRVGSVRDPDLAARIAAYPARARASGVFANAPGARSTLARCDACELADECRLCPAAVAEVRTPAAPWRVPEPLCALMRAAIPRRRAFPVQPDPVDVLRGRWRLNEGMRRVLAAVRGADAAPVS